ncbi:MAG: CDP-glucose 4,6-dehydratase [Coriobacteriia bacterium]|nr:CDP-glucose 4,6-dehydratase [Coriobacteriia bacterium]
MAELFGNAYAGRRVLITGHTGFKGSWLVEWLLMLGAEVSGYALEPPTDPSLFDELGLAERLTRHVIGDVRDLAHLREVIRAAAPEIVFHLAAQPLVRLSYETPVETYETNVMGTVNLLEAARSCPSVRAIVVVTSDKCYENRETGHAYREGDAMGGYDPYSSSKGCAELVTAAYRRSFYGEASPVRIASVRAGNVIGGGDWAADRIVPDCIRALEAGAPIVVRNPDAVRPWQHVLEPLSGYLYLGSRMLGGSADFDGPWNFGPEEQGTVPVREVADAIVAAWGSGTWTTPPQPGGPHEAHLLVLDITKVHEHLGWRPLYPVARTLEVTAAWYAARHEGADIVAITGADITAYADEAVRTGAVWANDRTTGSEQTT